eukprot:1733901-Pleurochrysis_carterae.AAC.8
MRLFVFVAPAARQPQQREQTKLRNITASEGCRQGWRRCHSACCGRYQTLIVRAPRSNRAAEALYLANERSGYLLAADWAPVGDWAIAR